MSKRLLLADDSITIQKVVELMLSEEDFEIRSVNNGEAALAAVKDFMPHVILADIEMPGINGYQLCEAVKGDDKTKDIPVILLAGAFEPIDEKHAEEVNADGYLIKPFESQELTAKIYSLFHEGVSTGGMIEGEVIGESIGAEQALKDKHPEPVPQPFPEERYLHCGGVLPKAASIQEAIEKTLPQREDIEEMLREILKEKASALIDSIDRDSLYIDILDAVEMGVDKRLNELDLREIAAGKVEISADERMIREVLEERVSALVNSLEISGMNRLIEEAIERMLTGILGSLSLPALIQDTIQNAVGNEVERILREMAPVAVERTVKALLEGSLSQLREQAEKAIWETIPGLAETIITQEIERIKSVF